MAAVKGLAGRGLSKGTRSLLGERGARGIWTGTENMSQVNYGFECTNVLNWCWMVCCTNFVLSKDYKLQLNRKKIVQDDPEMWGLIQEEKARQRLGLELKCFLPHIDIYFESKWWYRYDVIGLELIASENFCSRAALQVQPSMRCIISIDSILLVPALVSVKHLNFRLLDRV